MFYFPTAVTSEPSGNLIIADSKNDRLRRVVLHPTKLQGALTYGGGESPSGSKISYTATYSGLAFGIAPTGSVAFSDGSTSLGSANLKAATDASGIMSLPSHPHCCQPMATPLRRNTAVMGITPPAQPP